MLDERATVDDQNNDKCRGVRQDVAGQTRCRQRRLSAPTISNARPAAAPRLAALLPALVRHVYMRFTGLPPYAARTQLIGRRCRPGRALRPPRSAMDRRD